jgi:hypothetical protein
MPVFTNVIEIIVKGTSPPSSGGTRNIWNVFHYRLSGGTLDGMAQLLGDFETKVFSFVSAQLSADYTGVSLQGRLVDDATSQFVVSGTPANGAIALPRLPNEVSVVLPLQCVNRGRSFRGSKHFAPVPSSSVLKDELTAGAVTAWGVVATKVGSPFTSITGTYQPIVLSRILSQLKTNPTSLIGSDVSSALLNKTIGTMRKRKEKTQR